MGVGRIVGNIVLHSLFLIAMLATYRNEYTAFCNYKNIYFGLSPPQGREEGHCSYLHSRETDSQPLSLSLCPANVCEPQHCLL